METARNSDKFEPAVAIAYRGARQYRSSYENVVGGQQEGWAAHRKWPQFQPKAIRWYQLVEISASFAKFPITFANERLLQLNGTGDGSIKSIVNKQYNSPVGIYSEETIAETLSAQAEVLAGGVLG